MGDSSRKLNRCWLPLHMHVGCRYSCMSARMRRVSPRGGCHRDSGTLMLHLPSPQLPVSPALIKRWRSTFTRTSEKKISSAGKDFICRNGKDEPNVTVLVAHLRIGRRAQIGFLPVNGSGHSSPNPNMNPPNIGDTASCNTTLAQED